MLIFFQPFGHNQSQATILEENIILKATEVHFANKPAVSDAAKIFIRKCLAYRKDDRMDVHTMVKDPYLCPPQTKQQKAQAAAAAAQQQQQHHHNPHQQQQQQIQNMNFGLAGQFLGQNSGDS